MPADGLARQAGRRHRLASISCGAALVLLTAGAPVAAPSLEERLATCAGCHGETGISEMPETPSLAGQPVLFTQMQLFLFREGQRASEVMSPFAQGLSDEDLTALAEWYVKAAPPTPSAPPDPALDARGRELAVTYRCGTCHLPNYAGRDQMPRIAAQREDYLLKALRDYKAGARSGDGAQMAEVVYSVPDEDLKALAHHIAHFK
jgi:cytochrome c553